MPTAYRGRFEIRCMKERCTKDRVRGDVGIDCLGCDNSTHVAVDLESKEIGQLKAPKKKAKEE
jgi:hypothetical protein